MRSLRYHSTGKPREVLRLDDLPSPEPGLGEVRVRLTHRSINPADLHTILGGYAISPELPAVGGNEGVGVVDAVGPDVEGLEIGTRVVPMGAVGTWQECVVLSAEACLQLPDDIPDEAAAQLFVNPLTAGLMIEELGLEKGAWLLQTGGTSQVGRIVVQLARHLGIRTASIVRRESARAELEELGADSVIVADAESDARAVRRHVMELTNGRGAQAALDAVAGRIGGVAARCLADGGTMLVYGGLSGNPLSVEATTLIFNRIAVRGFWRTKWFDTHPLSETQRRLTFLAQLIVEKELTLPVEATYDLADFRDAITHARQPGTKGKVLLAG